MICCTICASVYLSICVMQAAAVARPVPSVVVMGQDEFHDALESAAEAGSKSSSSSDRQAESGQQASAAAFTFIIAVARMKSPLM
jgi:hypothetical protein